MGNRVDIPYEETEPLRPRRLWAADIAEGSDAVQGRVPLMGNNDVVLYVARPTEEDEGYPYSWLPEN